MTRALFFIVCVFPLISSGQAFKENVISFGVMFAPNISYRALNYSPSNQWVANLRNSEEIPNLGYSASATMQYRVSHTLKVEAGVTYSNIGERTCYQDLTWATNNASFPIRSRMTYHFNYVGVPLKLDYTFFQINKLSVFIAGGLTMNVFLSKKSKVEVEYADNSTDSHSSLKSVGYSRMNIGYVAGAGIEYEISDRIYTRLEPVFQNTMNSITIDSNTKEHLYTFGINAGIFYRIHPEKKE